MPFTEEGVEDLLENTNYYATHEARYFTVEWLPRYHFETWYLFLINVANANGLIAYSEYEGCFYYPDGTSEPRYARERLEKKVAEQNIPSSVTPDTIVTIMAQEHSESTQEELSPYLKDDKDKKSAIASIISLWMAENNITDFKINMTKETDIRVTFPRMNTTVSVEINFYTKNWEFNKPGSPYIKLYQTFSLRSVNYLGGINFNKGTYDIFSEVKQLPKEQHWYSKEADNIKEEIELKERIYTVTQLYQQVHDFLDSIKKSILPYNTLYELFDSIYTGENNILFTYYWNLPQNSSSRMLDMVLFARGVHYAKLQEVINKAISRLAENDVEPSEGFKERLETIMDGYEPKTAN